MGCVEEDAKGILTLFLNRDDNKGQMLLCDVRMISLAFLRSSPANSEG